MRKAKDTDNGAVGKKQRCVLLTTLLSASGKIEAAFSRGRLFSLLEAYPDPVVVAPLAAIPVMVAPVAMVSCRMGPNVVIHGVVPAVRLRRSGRRRQHCGENYGHKRDKREQACEFHVKILLNAFCQPKDTPVVIDINGIWMDRLLVQPAKLFAARKRKSRP